MALELWLAFVAASVVLVIIPGPIVLTVISYSVAYGRQATACLVSAVILGDIVVLLASIFGVGALLASSAFWFSVIKIIGGLYLLWLGFKLLKAGVMVEEISSKQAPNSLYKLFWNTFLVTALNPKALIFLMAFLPQFIDPQADTTQQLWILAITFSVLGALNILCYALFANSIRDFLNTQRVKRSFNILGGSLISLAGLWSLTAKHQG